MTPAMAKALAEQAAGAVAGAPAGAGAPAEAGGAAAALANLDRGEALAEVIHQRQPTGRVLQAMKMMHHMRAAVPTRAKLDLFLMIRELLLMAQKNLQSMVIYKLYCQDFLLTNVHALGIFSLIMISQGVQSISQKVFAGHTADNVIAISSYVSSILPFGLSDPTQIVIFFQNVEFTLGELQENTIRQSFTLLNVLFLFIMSDSYPK